MLIGPLPFTFSLSTVINQSVKPTLKRTRLARNTKRQKRQDLFLSLKIFVYVVDAALLSFMSWTTFLSRLTAILILLICLL